MLELEINAAMRDLDFERRRLKGARERIMLRSERVIHVLEDMLRGCVLDFPGSWYRYIPLMEFSYNNSYQFSIGMTPYEALYGRRCRTPMCWIELDEHKIIGLDLVKDTEEKVRIIQQRLKAVSDRQRSYANLKRKDI